MTEADPIVLRSVTVAEIMAEDGDIFLTVALNGDPTLSQQLGMLHAAMKGLEQDLAATWYGAPEGYDD